MAQQSTPKMDPMAALVVAGLLYIFYTEPSEKAMLFTAIAVGGWLYFRSCMFPIAAIVAFYITKLYNISLLPAGSWQPGWPWSPSGGQPPVGPVAPPSGPVDAGYPKDATSVQKRIERVKGPAPLQPKVATVTGVLESPTILDAAPLQPLETLASEALPGATIPASAKARVIINPPAEQTVPRDNNPNKQLMENPFLQNGPDDEGVGTALIPDGTVPVISGGDSLASLLNIESPF
jgi:hypothetical protein